MGSPFGTKVSARVLTISVGLAAFLASSAQEQSRRLASSAAEVILGDRLFFETRFAEYYFANSEGEINAPLSSGDKTVEIISRPQMLPLPGPFRGHSISCRHCHLGDDFIGTDPLAQRTYCDFTARSAIPRRNDNLTKTVRNTPIMIDIGLYSDVPKLLHFDGQFVSSEDLVIDTLTGRNMGWLLEEKDLAIAHISRVIRGDNGQNPRHVRDQQGRGIPYKIVLLGTDSSLAPHLRIPTIYRVDVQNASDSEIVQAIARLIHAYMDSLRFGNEDTNRSESSPYDRFLEKNQLPREPAPLESAQRYSERLLSLIENRTSLEWVTPQADGHFRLHAQEYVFGEKELKGLYIFFNQNDSSKGNCIACHIPPRFTDHRFHNTGVSQVEYDTLFGSGAFERLIVPDLATRNADFEEYLPASHEHPNALSRFRSAPSKERPGFADLGVWNVYANPDFPKPQDALTEILCTIENSDQRACLPESILNLTVGSFKTASIRNLGHSGPYFHSGAATTVDEAVRFYIQVSDLARAGRLRNGSRELLQVQLTESDILPIAAFLISLNEDYH